MPGAAVIEAVGLTKRYADVTAVDDLTFRVREGSVTGFLGPNGAGKTTTLRMVLGRARPSAGEATIGGRRYADLDDPARTVGANLEVAGAHPGRSGRNHLRALAALAGPARSPPWRACGARASTRSCASSSSTRRPTAAPASTRSGCASGSGWPPRCSAI